MPLWFCCPHFQRERLCKSIMTQRPLLLIWNRQTCILPVEGCAPSDGQKHEVPGVCGKRSGDKESGKLLKSADGSFLPKHARSPSGRTCL